MGAGIALAMVSVVKGEIPDGELRIWDLSFGECFNVLRGLSIGTSIVVALRPVRDAPAAERASWGPASLLPEMDYLVDGGCGQPLQVLTGDEVVEWTRRKIQ
jgi:hypothetical protein